MGGMQPRIPGVLMDHDLTTAQVTPTEAMEQKLKLLQKQAAIAVIEADNPADPTSHKTWWAQLLVAGSLKTWLVTSQPFSWQP